MSTTPSQKETCWADPTDPICADYNYNILVLEAASYMGFMTSEFLNYMEKMAYYSAREQYCIPARASEKIAMPELFDMVTGSETGAMIGSILV